MTQTRRVLASAMIIAGCGARGEPPPNTLPPVDAGTVQLPDSLVLTLAGGNTIWLSTGRRGADSTGKECVERSVEVRRASYRFKVPLLYTIKAPVPLDDTSFRAELYRDCARMASYRVLLKDGMPYRLPQ